MLKITITAIALLASSASLSASEFRPGTPGRWMDTINRIDLNDLPDSSEPIGRLNYAKAACKAKEDPAYSRCMRAQGFVWDNDTPAEIAARHKAMQDAQMRESGRLLGNALIDIGRQLEPHG